MLLFSCSAVAGDVVAAAAVVVVDSAAAAGAAAAVYVVAVPAAPCTAQPEPARLVQRALPALLEPARFAQLVQLPKMLLAAWRQRTRRRRNCATVVLVVQNEDQVGCQVG